MFSTLKNKVVGLISRQGKATPILVAFFIILGGTLFLAEPASAGWIAQTIADILNIVVGFMGKMILLLFEVAVGWLAPYNDFVRSAAVTTGWVLTRDIANMFFILVLLAIAFGTILKIESLNYQKILPKLLIMAVLINFSKTICGVVIDFAQVVMLTFVNAFLAAAGGNFLNALGIYRMMQINEASSLAIDDYEVVKAFFFAAAFLIVALIVIIVYVVVLAYRIVMLWILIIMAPLAWLAGAFPIGKASNAYAQWWDNFVGAVIVGPILAFFLWLALLTAGGGTLGSDFENPAYTQPTAEQQATAELTEVGGNNFFLNEQGTSESTTGFIIAVMLLLGGMAVAQQSGGMAGSFAGSVAGKTKGFVGGAIKGAAVGAGSLAVGAARKGAGWTERQVRGRERLYGAMGRIPGLKQVGLTNLAKVRSERAGKTNELAKVVSSLSPGEVSTLLSGPAVTQDQKDMRMLAHKQVLSSGYAKYLSGQGYTPIEVQKIQANSLNALENDAKARGNVDLMKEAGDYRDKNPHLIQDADKKKEAYRDASPEDMKKWSSDAWKDTIGLQALAEHEKENPGAVTSVLDKIGGQPKSLFNKFQDQYKGGNYPGGGQFTLEKGFEPAELSATEVFRERARTSQIDGMVRERNNVIVASPELITGADEGRKWSPTSMPAQRMREIQKAGGDAAQAYNYDLNSKRFDKDPAIDRVAAKNTFSEAVQNAARNVANEQAAPEIKADAAQFITNLDVKAIGASGEYRDAVLNNIDHQALAKAYQAAAPGEKGQVQNIIKGVSDALKDKMKDLGPDSEDYKKMFEKYQKMRLNQSINRWVS